MWVFQKNQALAGVASLLLMGSEPAAGQTAAQVEQTTPGTRPPAVVIVSFDGLGSGFTGPQGTATTRNPSDNSLAVGKQHVVQIVNSRMAEFTKKGEPLYGPVMTNSIFKGFGGPCETSVSGDAVVRYDQLANRWLFVLPIFRPFWTVRRSRTRCATR
jgi:hypothetical protein